MKDVDLRDVDSEDIDDLLLEIEVSFQMEFVQNELIYLNTFGELCDYIIQKIQLNNVNDCTRQQAFYKLREAILSILPIDRFTIRKDLLLKDILHRSKRRSTIKKLERKLEFKLGILRPAHWVTGILGMFLLGSLIWLFFHWQSGLVLLIISLSGLKIAQHFGNELNIDSIEEMVVKMTMENYLKCRRNPRTYHINEIENILINWFSESFGLDKNKLTRDTLLR
ncbi:hypothetical protein ACFRAE_00250 [Sphingobacterium sp. HJSM2_6]|uniref:hypothetical protein n=1 Tax=Sphingobacterium sp. HJSM2_6 TaxID=3366264 RepID=UPI003BDC4F38